MATIRLVPSTYTRSSTSRVTVTDPANMYYNTDHTGSYATIRGRNNTSNVYYAFIHGFNFNDVPSDAIINSFTVKIKAYRSSNLSTSNLPRLASTPSNNSAISNTTLSSAFTTDQSGAVYTFPTGSLTWNQIVGYGSNFSIHITLLSTSNQYPYAYVYGAEILVDYTIPVYHSVSITNNSSNATVSPSTTQSILEGSSQEITITTSDINSISVTDNNVDVTSSIIQHSISGSSDTLTFVPSGYTNETNTTNSANYQYTNAYKAATTSGTYARWEVTGNQSFSIYYTFSITGIPSNATITSVQVEAALRFSRQNASGSFTEDVQLYNGTTPMGEPLHFVTNGNSDIAMSLQTISNTGSWTPQTLQNLRFVMSGSNGATGTRRIYLNGVTLTISYEVPAGGYYYTYTISNITTDHTIVITDVSSGGMYIKLNGQWIKATKIYKKISNAWVEQTNFTAVFDPNQIYVSGN